ncbi:hypothetical protein HAX54_034869 [Datura stramonium]|uniref:TOG domain-containing protein n=1 Tax=Datura stramonium TaxID=4076 RepID=A0ABS8SET8_DATST|nr:hypothetical protein [Datura stramonium]
MGSKSSQFLKVQMEAILGPDLEPFEIFISDLIEKQSEAESLLKIMKQNDPNSLALKLASSLLSCHCVDILKKCAELLRLLLTDDDLCTWRNLSVSTQSTIKCILLSCIKQEESRFIIKGICYTVWKLAESLIPDNNWPELFPLLYQCVTASSSINKDLKVSVFHMFRQFAKDISETIVPCVKDLHSVFLNTLNDDTVDLEVRISAMSAVISFIQCVPSSKEKERFQDLFPGMMRTLTDAVLLNSEEEVASQDALKLFIELAKNEPRFLRRQLVDVVATMFEIAEAESLGKWTRYLAIDFLMILVEARERAPGMMKRLPLFINRCFAMLLTLLVDVKDDPAWYSVETFDATGITSNYCAGMMGLKRFSLALGGQSIAHIAIEQLCDYLDAPEWEKRHAALIALARIAEGCSKVMIKNLEQVVNMALNCFQDSHPRVKCAAVCAIGLLSLILSPHLQKQYHNQVLPALSAAMDDFHPRVQAYAIAALCNFCMFDKPEILIPHLDGIVNKLLVLLQHDKRMVQEEASKAFAYIADSVKKHFQTYYDSVMPHLKTVLRNQDLKYDLLLRARAMESISFVGRAVGKEKFREDAKQVIEVFISLQGLQSKGDDPSTKYLITACARICYCLGHDCLPYMSAIMPIYIQFAQLEPAMTIPANKENVLDVKAKACAMILDYAAMLKEDFYPWISQVVSILVPLLQFDAHNPVRKSATNAMSVLLCSAKLAEEKGIAQGGIESYLKELTDYIIPALVEALHKEPVIEICATMLEGLGNCLQICGPLLSECQLRRIMDEIKHVIKESSHRRGELREREKTEDFDAEEAELAKGEKVQEDRILSGVCSILKALIKTFKASFLPFFDELSSYLIPTWGKDVTAQERFIATCIIHFLLLECPEVALKYYDVFLPLLVEASNDEVPEFRQLALYGFGLYAEYGGSVFKPFLREVISRINVEITHIHVHEPENAKARDAAAFALGKICQFHRESIDAAQVVPIWLNCLPMKVDWDESRSVHEQLCSMVERLDKDLIGSNYEYLPKIISVFAEVLCTEKDLATEETANHMINVLRHLQQTLPPAIMESAWSYLLPQQEMELKSILSPEEDVYF